MILSAIFCLCSGVQFAQTRYVEIQIKHLASNSNVSEPSVCQSSKCPKVHKYPVIKDMQKRWWQPGLQSEQFQCEDLFLV